MFVFDRHRMWRASITALKTQHFCWGQMYNGWMKSCCLVEINCYDCWLPLRVMSRDPSVWTSRSGLTPKIVDKTSCFTSVIKMRCPRLINSFESWRNPCRSRNYNWTKRIQKMIWCRCNLRLRRKRKSPPKKRVSSQWRLVKEMVLGAVPNIFALSTWKSRRK